MTFCIGLRLASLTMVDVNFSPQFGRWVGYGALALALALENVRCTPLPYHGVHPLF